MKTLFGLAGCCVLAAGILLQSCASPSRHEKNPSPSDSLTTENAGYHADNDIAMTVKSVVSTINDGDKVHPDQYDFSGVMTDGQGRIIFTSDDGSPGNWVVKVLSPDSVEISARKAEGFPENELREYVVSSLGHSPDTPTSVDNDEGVQKISYYDGNARVDFRASLHEYTISISRIKI